MGGKTNQERNKSVPSNSKKNKHHLTYIIMERTRYTSQKLSRDTPPQLIDTTQVRPSKNYTISSVTDGGAPSEDNNPFFSHTFLSRQTNLIQDLFRSATISRSAQIGRASPNFHREGSRKRRTDQAYKIESSLLTNTSHQASKQATIRGPYFVFYLVQHSMMSYCGG